MDPGIGGLGKRFRAPATAEEAAPRSLEGYSTLVPRPPSLLGLQRNISPSAFSPALPLSARTPWGLTAASLSLSLQGEEALEGAVPVLARPHLHGHPRGTLSPAGANIFAGTLCPAGTDVPGGALSPAAALFRAGSSFSAGALSPEGAMLPARALSSSATMLPAGTPPPVAMPPAGTRFPALGALTSPASTRAALASSRTFAGVLPEWYLPQRNQVGTPGQALGATQRLQGLHPVGGSPAGALANGQWVSAPAGLLPPGGRSRMGLRPARRSLSPSSGHEQTVPGAKHEQSVPGAGHEQAVARLSSVVQGLSASPEAFRGAPRRAGNAPPTVPLTRPLGSQVLLSPPTRSEEPGLSLFGTSKLGVPSNAHCRAQQAASFGSMDLQSLEFTGAQHARAQQWGRLREWPLSASAAPTRSPLPAEHKAQAPVQVASGLVRSSSDKCLGSHQPGQLQQADPSLDLLHHVLENAETESEQLAPQERRQTSLAGKRRGIHTAPEVGAEGSLLLATSPVRETIMPGTQAAAAAGSDPPLGATGGGLGDASGLHPLEQVCVVGMDAAEGGQGELPQTPMAVIDPREQLVMTLEGEQEWWLDAHPVHGLTSVDIHMTLPHCLPEAGKDEHGRKEAKPCLKAEGEDGTRMAMLEPQTETQEEEITRPARDDDAKSPSVIVPGVGMRAEAGGTSGERAVHPEAGEGNQMRGGHPTRKKSRVERLRRARVSDAFKKLRTAVHAHGDMASVLDQAADFIAQQQDMILQLERQLLIEGFLDIG